MSASCYAWLQKAHSSGEDEPECSEKDDAEGLFIRCVGKDGMDIFSLFVSNCVLISRCSGYVFITCLSYQL